MNGWVYKALHSCVWSVCVYVCVCLYYTRVQRETENNAINVRILTIRNAELRV